MPDLLKFVLLKQNRALAQIEQLNKLISSWVKESSMIIDAELREERLGVRVIFKGFNKPAPLDEWGLLAGECIHNMRSSLDNLAFALARLQCDPPDNPNRISFPIYKDQAKFMENGRRNIDQLPADAASLIEKIQPFQRHGSGQGDSPDKDPLALLQELNNADKHRIPSIVFLATEKISFTGDVKFYSDNDAANNVSPNIIINPEPLEVGSTLYEWITTKPIELAGGTGKVDASVALQTSRGNLEFVDILTKLFQYTKLVTSGFEKFFQ